MQCMSPRGFLYRPLVFCVWLFHAADHPPSLLCGWLYIVFETKPIMSSSLCVFSQVGEAFPALSLPNSFLHLLFSTLRCRQSHPEVSSEPPWGVLRALFGIILCIHSIAFTPVSLQLGFYFSNHSLWHLHHLFSPGLHRNTSVIARIFLPSNVLYSLAYRLLFLQALVPPHLTPSLSLEHHP